MKGGDIMEETQNSSNNSKKSLSPVLLFGVLALVLIAGGFVYVFVSGKPNSSKTEEKQETQVAPTQNKQKFVDTDEGKNAFKIFPGELSADAKNALVGFDLKTKVLADGSTEVTLVAKKQEYTTQTLTVKQGESVYFIEKFGLDDNKSEDADKNLNDDSAVVVDSQGYLVK